MLPLEHVTQSNPGSVHMTDKETRSAWIVQDAVGSQPRLVLILLGMMYMRPAQYILIHTYVVVEMAARARLLLFTAAQAEQRVFFTCSCPTTSAWLLLSVVSMVVKCCQSRSEVCSKIYSLSAFNNSLTSHWNNWSLCECSQRCHLKWSIRLSTISLYFFSAPCLDSLEHRL